MPKPRLARDTARGAHGRKRLNGDHGTLSRKKGDTNWTIDRQTANDRCFTWLTLFYGMLPSTYSHRRTSQLSLLHCCRARIQLDQHTRSCKTAVAEHREWLPMLYFWFLIHERVGGKQELKHTSYASSNTHGWTSSHPPRCRTHSLRRGKTRQLRICISIIDLFALPAVVLETVLMTSFGEPAYGKTTPGKPGRMKPPAARQGAPPCTLIWRENALVAPAVLRTGGVCCVRD